MKPIPPTDRRIANIKTGAFKPFVYEVGLRSGTEHCSYSPTGRILALHIADIETTIDEPA